MDTTTGTHPSVLRLHNVGPLNVFTETGILFSTVNDYDTARIYATLDCPNAGSCERITLQTHFPGNNIYLDTLNVKEGTVGIGTINPAATLDVEGNVKVLTLASASNNVNVCWAGTGILSRCMTDQQQDTVVGALQEEVQTQLQQIKAQRQEIDGLKLQLQQQNASLQERLSKLESYVATQMKIASDNPPRTTPGANGGLQ